MYLKMVDVVVKKKFSIINTFDRSNEDKWNTLAPYTLIDRLNIHVQAYLWTLKTISYN